MADRKPLSKAATADAEFSEIKVQRSLSDVALAKTHAIGRNRRVGQFLCLLGLLRAEGLVPAKTRCRVTGAEVQDFNAEGANEAAHYIPGHALLWLPGAVTPVEPWSLAKDPRSRESIGRLFSRVQDLHANFNKADSYAEKYARPALKLLFQQACQAVLDAPPLPGKGLNLPAVRKAYGDWIAQSIASYRYAINRKIDIAELDDLPPATAGGWAEPGLWDPHLLDLSVMDLNERVVRKNKTGGGSTVWDYSEQTRILGHYLTATEGSTLSDAELREVQELFKG